MYGTILFMGALVAATSAPPAGSGADRVYPPCSRTVTDSCVQRSHKANIKAEQLYQGVGGPFEPIDDAVEEHATAAPAETASEPLNVQDPSQLD